MPTSPWSEPAWLRCLAAILAGAALAAGLLGLELALLGAEEPAPWAAAPAGLGLGLGLSLAPRAALALPLLGLAGLLPWLPAPDGCDLGAGALGLGLLAGALLAPARGRPRLLAASAGAGAIPPLALGAALPAAPWLLVALLAAGASWALSRHAAGLAAPAASGPRARLDPAGLLAVALIGLRLGAVTGAGAALLALCRGPDGATLWTPLGACAAAVACALAAAQVVLLAGLRWSALRGRWTWLACEPLGWLVLAALCGDGPGLLLGGGEGARVLLMLSAALAALGLLAHLGGPAAWGLLAAAPGWALGVALLNLGAGAWPMSDRLALALGRDPTLETSAPLDTSQARVLGQDLAPPAVHRLELGTARLETVGGELRDLASSDPARLAGPTLAGALPALAGIARPTRLAALGSGAEEACRVASATPGAALEVSGGASALGFLRRARADALLVRHPPREPLPELAARAAPCTVWLVHGALRRGDLAALRRASERVWVFAPAPEQLVLLAGPALAEPALATLRERWEGAPELAAALGRTGIGDPAALLARLVAGPEAVTALAGAGSPGDRLDPAGLAAELRAATRPGKGQ